MKDGVLLRQVINIIDELNFDDYNDKHAFGEIYEKITFMLDGIITNAFCTVRLQ